MYKMQNKEPKTLPSGTPDTTHLTLIVQLIFKIILYKYLINKLQKLLQIKLDKQKLQIGLKFIKFSTFYHQN